MSSLEIYVVLYYGDDHPGYLIGVFASEKGARAAIRERIDHMIPRRKFDRANREARETEEARYSLYTTGIQA